MITKKDVSIIYINITLLALPFLNGCAPYYLFGPTRYGSSHHFEFHNRTRGGLMGDAEAALLDRKTESIIVGWEHLNDDQRVHNHIYRGAVKFNVELLKELPKKTVTKATLNYTIENGANEPSKGFILSCATKTYLASSEWEGIPNKEAPDTIDGLLFKKNLVEAPLGSKMSIDVTDVVKDWVNGKKENHGFVFGATNEEKGLIENNDKCWTMLGGLTLRIDYKKT